MKKVFSRLMAVVVLGLLFAACATEEQSYPATLNVENMPNDLQYVAVFPNDTAFTITAIENAAHRRPYYPNYDMSPGHAFSTQ